MSGEINATDAEKALMEQQLIRWNKIIFIRKNSYCGTVENTENSRGDVQRINELLAAGWELKPLSPEQ